MSSRKIEIDGETLTIQDVISVARNFVKTAIAHSSRKKVETAAKLVNKWSKAGKVIYGVTTGFGPLAGEVISDDQAELAQYNLIISHAAGVGEHFQSRSCGPRCSCEPIPL